MTVMQCAQKEDVVVPVSALQVEVLSPTSPPS